MATLSVQSIIKGGLEPVYSSAAGGGDQFTLGGVNDIVHVINGGGGSITVTIVTQATTDGLAIADRTVSVGAGEERKISDLDPNVYRDTNGFCQLTYSGVSSVTIGVFRSAGA